MEDYTLDSKIITEVIVLKETVKQIQETLNKPFYDRRKTVIVMYNNKLTALIDKIKKLNIITDGTISDYQEINNQYSEAWAKTDFYSFYKTWIGRVVYDYSASIEYHHLRRIAIEITRICLDRLTKIETTKQGKHLTLYCSEIDLTMDNAVKALTKINIELQTFNQELKTMFLDTTTKRYY